MSDGFDPYREWLEIRGDRRPPSHYALLGLREFESDAEQIRAAAMTRMQLLRTFTLGPDRETALRLIAEVTAAVACVSDVEHKRAYDHELCAASTVLLGPATNPGTDRASRADAPREDRAAAGSDNGAWNVLPHAIAEDPGQQGTLPAAEHATHAAERNLVLWCLGGVVAAVFLLIFSARSFFRTTKESLPDPNAPAPSAPAEPAATAKAPAIPTSIDSTAADSQRFEGSGTLTELMGHDNEVHLVVRMSNAAGIADCEAFVLDPSFAAQVADYVPASAKVGPGELGDTVHIVGTTADRTGPRPAFRLRPELSLVHLQEIERQGDSRSRAVVGQTRDPGSFRAGYSADPLRLAFRFHPSAGTVLNFPARLLTQLETSLVKLSPHTYTERSEIKLSPLSQEDQVVSLTLVKQDKDLADYVAGDLVDVSATAERGSPHEPLQLHFQSICRHGEPSSLVTKSGRAKPVDGLDAAIRQWAAVRNDPCNHLQESVELLGTFESMSGSDRGGSFLIHLNSLMYFGKELKLFWAKDAACYQFLSQLKSSDPVAVRAVVLGGEIRQPLLAVQSIASRKDPLISFKFSSVQESARVPGALLRRWKSQFGPSSSPIAWSPDGRYLMHMAGRADDVELVLRDVDRGAADRRFPIGPYRPQATAFSHDGKRVAFVDSEGTIYHWNVEEGTGSARELKPQKETPWLRSSYLAWNADDSRLWVGAPGMVQACLLGDGPRRLIPSLTDCTMLAPHPQDRNLVASVPGNGKWVTITDLHDDKSSRSIVMPDGRTAFRNMLTRQVPLKPPSKRRGANAGRTAATVDEKAIDRYLAKQVFIVAKKPARGSAKYRSVAWNAAGDRLAIAAQYEVEVWDVSDKRLSQLVQTLPAEGDSPLKHWDTFDIVAWSPDGAYLAAGVGSSLRVWAVDGWYERVRAELGYSAVESLAWRPDSTALASKCSDGSMQVLYVGDDPAKKEDPAIISGSSGLQPPKPDPPAEP